MNHMQNNQILKVPDLQPPEVAKLLKLKLREPLRALWKLCGLTTLG